MELLASWIVQDCRVTSEGDRPHAAGYIKRSCRANLLLTAVPMFRKTLTILSLLGLVLFVGLWVASYWNWKYTDSRVRLMLSGGRVIYLMDYVAHGEHGFHFDGWSKWTPTKWWPERSDWPGQRWIAIPLWLPALIFATPYAALRLTTIWRRYRRERKGLCVRCGHKLDGSRVRCPTCAARVYAVSVLRGVVIRCVFVATVLVSGFALASYRDYSWTSWNGSGSRSILVFVKTAKKRIELKKHF